MHIAYSLLGDHWCACRRNQAGERVVVWSRGQWQGPQGSRVGETWKQEKSQTSKQRLKLESGGGGKERVESQAKLETCLGGNCSSAVLPFSWTDYTPSLATITGFPSGGALLLQTVL